MFWRFGGYSNISTIDTLLDKPNVKLEDLLEESDLIQELKSHHTKLIEYLRDEANLHALLKYVVAPGKPAHHDEDDLDEKGKRREEDDRSDEEQEKAEKKRLKYAYVACEILSCETWSLTEALMANTPYLTDFWQFLRRPAPLDPLQAGYFTKVNETLLEKKTEDMLDFFKSLPQIVPAMLQHVDCPMVMDLLLKIISLEKADGGAGIVDWLHSQHLVPMLLANLSPESSSSTQTSAGDFLKAIITISANAAQNEQSCIGPNSLTRQLVSEKCMKSLVSSMLRGGNPLTVGVGIVIEVIRKNNSDYDPESGHNPDAAPTNHDPIYLGTLLRLFADHVPDFMELILSSRHTITEGDSIKVVERGQLKSAWGTHIEPLGFDRFKTCELMAELLHCSNMGLLNESGSEELIKARDEEREKLRSQGAFNPSRQPEGSSLDISTSSSRFEQPSASGSIEELRIANTSEEEEFEKVVAPKLAEASNVSSDAGSNDDLVDEPLSPNPSQPPSIQQTTDNLSPGATLTEGVRRLSMEHDTVMTDSSTTTSSDDEQVEESLPHPEYKPAPLFSKSKDPNKTPTATSPEAPASPKTPRKFGEQTQPGDQPTESPAQDITGNVSSDQTPVKTSEEPPVVGDHLKIMFVENRVVPTILSFFFRFPWNNFLHNVVYDVVQQVFNGPMERGYNKYLAFDLFETGRITEQIINGQKASDESQRKKNMRLGYMGHLTLVAEEVVKFGERHPREVLAPSVQEYVYGKDWEDYVTKTLAETRDRDNAILGGFRPENGLGPRQAVLNAVNSGNFGGSAALSNAGLNGGAQGLDSIDLSNNGSATSAGYNSAGSLLSGFGSSSDDEDEEMDDADDDEQYRTVSQFAVADAGLSTENADAPVPLIPPPPAPLNIEPSRARRRLADRLARHKQEAEQEVAASEFGSEADDPFAALGDNDDDQDANDPFSLDEEEQDITSQGRRNIDATNSTTNNSNNHAGDHSGFSVSRGLTSLFSSSGSANRQLNPKQQDDFDESLGDTSSEGSGSDVDPEHPPLEARRSLERRPLDVEDDDDDEDEEMGEMVAPTEEGNSSDEEVLSPVEKERIADTFGAPSPDDHSEFDGQDDQDNSDEDDGDALVEIAMPVAVAKRRSRG